MAVFLKTMNISPLKLNHGFAGCMYSPSLGHEHLPQEVSQSMNESHGLMRASRLLLGGRNLSGAHRFPIRFLLGQHPICRLGQMTRDRYHRLGMSFALHDSLIKLPHTAIGHPTLIQNNAIGRLDESPLEV